MRIFFKPFFFIGIFMLVMAPLSGAQDSFIRPDGYVNDVAGVLSEGQRRFLNTIALELERKTTAQVAVVTLSSIKPYTIEEYAVKLFEHWGIGRRWKDNGVLLLVALEDREVRLEVGYGLEGALTDAVSKSIIERYMVPAFREGAYERGIREGVLAVVSIVAKEYGATVTGQEHEVYQSVHRQGSRSSDAVTFVIFLGMMILFILNPRLFFYTMMFSSMGGRGSWSSGGGGFGGGFGGFGGGMSGGGGASGRW